MKIAELSRRSGVPTSSIKFYLRDGLLPAGSRTAHNQADYGERHVERLALIRALREVARLPLEQIARVTAELDRALAEGWSSDADPIGLALRAAHAPPSGMKIDATDEAVKRVRAELGDRLRALPWTIAERSDEFAEELLAPLLDVRRYLYPDYPISKLDVLARLAWRLSEVEYAEAPGGARVPLESLGDDIAEPTRRAIISSLLFERIFGILRRCANTMRAHRISRGAEVPAAE